MSEQKSLGRYIILGKLGEGGFATVYRARDTVLEREIALKVLNPIWANDPNVVNRFMREARQAARLNHPNIVTIHDVGRANEADGRLFIAMELVPGRSVQRAIAEDGPLSLERALLILEQAASALDYAHQQGLVHRDIKPANILLNETRPDAIQALLTDFGLVRAAEQSTSASLSVGGILGTPEYIAPEIWDGQTATTASDMYALACVAHYMISGQVLFSGPTPMSVLKRHLDGPVFPQQWPTEVPPGVVEVLQQALARDPAKRPATASQMVTGMKERVRQAMELEQGQEVARRESERQAAQEAERLARVEAERRVADEAARRAREEQERLAREQAQRQAQAAEQKTREEREWLARQAALQEEARRREQLAAEQKAQAQARQPQAPGQRVETTPVPQRTVGWGLWWQWVGATAAGWIAVSLSALLGIVVMGNSLLGIVATLLVAPLAIGVAQWLVLRKYIDKAWHWIVATGIGAIGGAVVGGIVGGIVSAILTYTLGYGFMNSSITAFFGSVAAGTGIGLAQWIVLRRRVQKAGWWILATTVGLVVPIVFSSTFYSSLWPIGLVGWLAQGAITGAVLVWLLNLNRPKQGAEETPVARARLPWWGWVAIVIAVIACLICGLGTLSYLPTLLRQFGFQ